MGWDGIGTLALLSAAALLPASAIHAGGKAMAVFAAAVVVFRPSVALEVLGTCSSSCAIPGSAAAATVRTVGMAIVIVAAAQFVGARRRRGAGSTAA